MLCFQAVVYIFMFTPINLNCFPPWSEEFLFVGGNSQQRVVWQVKMLRTGDRMDAQPFISIPTSPAMAEAQETSPKGSWKECEGRGSVVTGCLLDRMRLLPRRTHSGCGYSHKIRPPKLKPAKILAGWADDLQDSTDSHWRRELILFWGCRHW